MTYTYSKRGRTTTQPVNTTYGYKNMGRKKGVAIVKISSSLPILSTVRNQKEEREKTNYIYNNSTIGKPTLEVYHLNLSLNPRGKRLMFPVLAALCGPLTMLC